MKLNLETIRTNNNAVSAILLFFSVLLYANTIGHEYNLDDNLVTQNHQLTSKGVKAIPKIFTSHFYQDQNGYSYEYRPVTLTSFAIEHQFFGESPHISHLINVLLYALTGIILFILLKSLVPSMGNVFHLAVCLLFLSHPLHTEVVSSIKNRDELLALLFSLISWYYAWMFLLKGNALAILLAVLFFALGVLSKLSVFNLSLIIPCSIVFLTRPKLKYVFILSFCYSIITYLFNPLEVIKLKILYFTLVLFLPLFIGVISQKLIPFKSFLKFMSSLGSTKAIKTFTKGSLPVPLVVILVSIPVISIALGVHYWLEQLIYIGTLLPCFFILIFNRRYSSLFLIEWVIILTFCAYFLFDKQTVLLAILPSVFLLMSGFIEKNKLNTSLLALFIIASSYFIGLSIIPLAIVFLLVILLEPQKAVLASFIAYLLYLFYSLFFNDDPTSYILPAVASATLLLMLFQRLRKYSVLLFMLVFVFIGNTDYSSIGSYDRGELITNEQLKTINLSVNEAIGGQDRPLTYLESPIYGIDDLEIKFGTSMYVLGEYLKKLFIPNKLGFYYGYAYIKPVGISNIQVVISIIAYLSLFFIALLSLKKHKILSLGLFVYLVNIFLFSNYFYPVVGAMGDRFAYVASLGFCVSTVYIIYVLYKYLDGKTSVNIKNYTAVFMAVILSLYSFKTFSRSMLWKDPLTLMEHDIKYLNKSAQAHNLLAGYSMQEYFSLDNDANAVKYLDQAIDQFKMATQIYPHYLNYQFDLGRAQLIKGNQKEALRAFKKAVEIDSSFNTAVLKVAGMYLSTGQYKKSIPYFELAIKNEPENTESYISLAFAWFNYGNLDQALSIGIETTKRFPDLFDPWSNLGKIYLKVNNKSKAVVSFEKAFQIRKDENIAMYLSEWYREQGDIKKALYYESFYN